MSVTVEEFPKNVRRNKQILSEQASLITGEIQKRRASPGGWDFRFMIIVSQWLLEQGKYTMTPKGNNPGNVMGKGDQESFTRSDNTEIIDGARVSVPDAKFAKYSSMIVGTSAFFNRLRDHWPRAYEAALVGDSSDKYVDGLFPGPRRDYATGGQALYRSGMRIRLVSQVIPQYILACEDDIKEIDETASKISGRNPIPGESLDYRNDLRMNQNSRLILVNLLEDLRKTLGRVKAGQRIQA